MGLAAKRLRGDLAHLPAKRVTDLLAELDMARDCVDRDDGDELPEMTILLDGGHLIRGRLLRYEATDGQETLLLERTQLSGRLDVTYVPLDSILALTVHVSEGDLKLLSFGQLLPATV